jgi:hypothetical protein
MVVVEGLFWKFPRKPLGTTKDLSPTLSLDGTFAALARALEPRAAIAPAEPPR